MPEVVQTSELPAPAEMVWKRVASLEGINHELGPWLRMTAPRGATLTVEDVPLGRRWFRSWVLLLGVIPFDYDDLCVVRLEPGAGFLEHSTMLSARVWEHERTLEPCDGARATRLTDRVRFEPRLRVAARLQRALVAAAFRHRHRRLAAYFADA